MWLLWLASKRFLVVASGFDHVSTVCLLFRFCSLQHAFVLLSASPLLFFFSWFLLALPSSITGKLTTRKKSEACADFLASGPWPILGLSWRVFIYNACYDNRCTNHCCFFWRCSSIRELKTCPSQKLDLEKNKTADDTVRKKIPDENHHAKKKLPIIYFFSDDFGSRSVLSHSENKIAKKRYTFIVGSTVFTIKVLSVLCIELMCPPIYVKHYYCQCPCQCHYDMWSQTARHRYTWFGKCSTSQDIWLWNAKPNAYEGGTQASQHARRLARKK